MDSLKNLLWFDGQFLGIAWSVWKVVGWTGNLIFFSRFFVQWYATEKRGQVVVPVVFWWLSLVGSMLLLVYAVFHNEDSVFIFAYALAWIPYVRNLIIHRRHLNAHLACPHCAHLCLPKSRFCSACGTNLGITAT